MNKPKLIQRPRHVKQNLRNKNGGKVLQQDLQSRLYEIRDEITTLFLNDPKARKLAATAILSGRNFDYRVTGDIRHQAANGLYDQILDRSRRELGEDNWFAVKRALSGQADATITQLLVTTAISLTKKGLL